MRRLDVVAMTTLALGSSCVQEPAARERLPSGDPTPVPTEVRVLYLEEAPRWEYRYLKNALLRSDPNVNVQVYLFDAGRDFPQEATDGTPSLQTYPRTREELFAYDVVLLGDVPPERFGALPAERAAWLTLLTEFAQAGGGVGFLAGERAMPNRYRDTPIEKLLPVELEPAGGAGEKSAITGTFVPRLAMADHEVVQLRSTTEQNTAMWEQGFPPLMAYYPVARAAEGADVVLVHPEHRNDHGPRVIAAAAQHDRGKTFFLATDETWRWRKPYGEKYQDTFWLNVVQYLGRDG